MDTFSKSYDTLTADSDFGGSESLQGFLKNHKIGGAILPVLPPPPRGGPLGGIWRDPPPENLRISLKSVGDVSGWVRRIFYFFTIFDFSFVGSKKSERNWGRGENPPLRGWGDRFGVASLSGTRLSLNNLNPVKVFMSGRREFLFR